MLLPVMKASRVANTRRMQSFILFPQLLVDFLLSFRMWLMSNSRRDGLYAALLPPCFSKQPSCARGKISKKHTTTLFSMCAPRFHFSAFTCAVMRRDRPEASPAPSRLATTLVSHPASCYPANGFTSLLLTVELPHFQQNPPSLSWKVFYKGTVLTDPG